MCKQLRAIQDVLKREGVCATVTKAKRRGHFRIEIAGASQCIFTSATPGDHRAILNFRARVRRVAAGGLA